MTRTSSAAWEEMASPSHLRMAAWTSWACSVVATLPVPMALGMKSVIHPSVWDVTLEGGLLPDGLVGNDNLSPLLLAQLLSGSVELAGDDLNSLVGLTLLNYYQRSRV